MSVFDAQQALTQAAAHHRVGRLAEAERLYRQVLQHNPADPDALHLLGALAGQTGNLDLGIDLIRRAISLNPDMAAFHSNLAGFYHLQSCFAQAAESFSRAVQLKPDFFEAQHGLSMSLRSLGRLDESIAAGRRAVALRPDNALAHNALGAALVQKPLLDEAVVELRRAVELDPSLSDAHNNLGLAFSNLGKIDLAIAAFQYAIRLRPDLAAAYANLGAQFRDKDRPDDAVAVLQEAIKINPKLAAAHFMLGLIDFDAGRFDQALAAVNYGMELDPNLAVGQWNRGLIYLLQGNYESGWRDYESRLRDPASFKSRQFPVPRWDGSDLAGRRLLVHCEQGLGDAFQFIRFLPRLASKHGTVIFACHAELARLLPRVPGADEMAYLGSPLPPFDLHIQLLSLPHILNIGSAVSAQVPYIIPDASLVQQWSTRIEGPGLRVGLAWAGRPTHKNDRNRSIRLNQLLPILKLPNIRFYSLQKGRGSRQIADLPPDVQLIDFSQDFHDFADTAALIANLDLVIAVDTAVAHLSAAMAKPTWILLPFIPDWRWMLEREDCPWYPTVRLFRQKSRGDWNEVIDRVAGQLLDFPSRENC